MQQPPTSPNSKQLRIGRAAALFVFLFVVAIPWWWRFLPEIGSRVVMGAPLWFVTSIVGSLIVSAVSARYLAIAWDSLDAESDADAKESGDGE
jgi:hypothetical protein